MIELDSFGRPQRVSIRDHADRLKFTGVLIYDGYGRLREERLMNASGQLVRTRVQNYDANGRPLPIKTVISEHAVGSDISLIVTEQSARASSGGGQAAQAMQAPTQQAQPEKKKKGGLLRKIFPFGRKDD